MSGLRVLLPMSAVILVIFAVILVIYKVVGSGDTSASRRHTPTETPHWKHPRKSVDLDDRSADYDS